MSKRTVIIIGSISGLLILVVIASFIANPIIENKIKKTIALQVPDEFQINEYEISVNSFSGSVTIENLEATLKDTIALFKDSKISLKKASVNGLSYWKYLFLNKIAVDDVTLYDLHIKTYRDNTETDTSDKQQKDFEENISTGKFTLDNASFLFKNTDESIALQIDSLNFSIKNVVVNQTTLQQKIPSQFSNMEFESKSLLYQLNDYDLLSLSKITLSNHELQIEDLAIKTIYSKTELSRVISKERDHMDVEMPLVTLKDFHFNVIDSTFKVAGSDLIIDNPTLIVYRDKLVADDTSIKPLYSKSIRIIPFPLTLDSLHVNNAIVVYEEKVSARQPAGAINFSNLNASIGNLSNTYALGEKKTTIHINSIFMDESPLNIEWSFDVNDLKDTFQIQGELDALNATKMNSFTKASLNVELEGKIKKTFFNIHGNNERSSIDLRISYDNLKVEILNKENKRNWLLSSVANIFVKKDTDSREGSFIEGKGTAERNKDKSFFNYLWISIQEGLKDVMVAI